MDREKLFSSKLKAHLAGLATNYAHNHNNAKNLALYARQAAEYEWLLWSEFLKVARSAKTTADLQEICTRIEGALKTKIPLKAATLVEQLTELVSVIEKRMAKATATARRLRKVD